jgi:magnesium transporter
LWVDIDDRDDRRSIEEVVRLLGLADVDLDRLGADGGRARLTRTTDRLHITLESLEAKESPEGDRLIRRELDIIAAPNVVLTAHDGPVAALDRFRKGLDGETRLGKLSAGDLMSSLIDEVLVEYFLLAEVIEREIDALDQRALQGRPGDDILAAIVALRRRVGMMRRTLAPHRDALSTLGLPELAVEETVGRPWPGLVDRLEAAMGVTENLRDGLLGTFDIHMGRVSQRANDVMRTLTLLSAVLLPAVVLAGIMGMNFKLAFFDETTNFWLVLVGMVALAVSILGVARWRHWL